MRRGGGRGERKGEKELFLLNRNQHNSALRASPRGKGGGEKKKKGGEEREINSWNLLKESSDPEGSPLLLAAA